jgi:elongator complex protein 1
VAFYAGDASAGTDVDIPDDISLAPTDASTSGGTFMTRYTGRTTGTLNTQTSRRTSKNKRREERKRARGKKGSVYEEEYLVNSIGRLIERVNSVNEDVGHLAAGILRRCMREQARAIEDAMIEVLALCNAVVVEVYEIKPKEGHIVDGLERPTGGDAVLWDALETVQAARVAPIISGFERLSLLG